MREGLMFVYDGVRSDDMGLYHVNIGNGLMEESFIAGKEILETHVRGNDTPYFQGVKRSPLSLSLTFAFIDQYDESKIRAVARWLDQDFYKPFYTMDNPNRIWYCMLDSDSRLLHNGLKQGYVELQMRCDSPYTYSQIRNSQVYDLSLNNPNGTKIKIYNYGDIICYPTMTIQKVGDGDISIFNCSVNQEMILRGLIDNETITIDSQREFIESDIDGMYRYDNHNDIFISFSRGSNQLIIKGNLKMRFQYQFKTLQG